MKINIFQLQEEVHFTKQSYGGAVSAAKVRFSKLPGSLFLKEGKLNIREDKLTIFAISRAGYFTSRCSF